MQWFHGTPVLVTGDDAADAGSHVMRLDGAADLSPIDDGIRQGRLVAIRPLEFERAAQLFGQLVDRYGLRDSYEAQMQYVVGLMNARDAVGDVAVTVNKRGPYEMVQPHSEGDSTAPLDLFALYCVVNAESGGENILGLINQNADHSRLRAKEKAILDRGLSTAESHKLRRHHLDAKEIVKTDADVCRTLVESKNGSIVVRQAPLAPAVSAISGESIVTYWDNVTVHDRAFHRYHFELLNHLGIFTGERSRDGYEASMHVESDSPWAPADTDSGDLDQTSQLFTCQVVHKMQPGELLVFNNRVWTHSANNWPPSQTRTLHAMYA